MFHIYTSNRLEQLANDLAEVIKSPLPNPLAKEIIVVQSQGMARWVTMELAEKLGIWTNSYFPFPDAFIWQTFKRLLGQLPDTSKFDRKIMTWTIMELLPDYLAQPEFAELQHYLESDTQNIKLYQLSLRIADTFDQYLVFRPEWIQAWEDNKQPDKLKDNPQAHWQAILWRALIQRFGKQHRATLREKILEEINYSPNKKRLPPRLCVFGISALPPFYLDIFAALGNVIDVHIFIMNPCQAYWGDILSDADIARRTPYLRKQKMPLEDAYFTKGNSLLASMGKLGRDFIDLLINYEHEAIEKFIPLPENHLLSHIQSDILQLREYDENALKEGLTADLFKTEKITINPQDNSIQVHLCHSPMREVEVLHDQLLALFEMDATLQPKDIIVMMPNVETYAPFIEAVFDTISEKHKKIPFSIADRHLRSESLFIDAFFALLSLRHSRFNVNEILAILEMTPVQQRFDLSAQDLDTIRHWLEKTGVRWGIDGENKGQLDLPAFEENTWQAGLKRLMLGYALPGKQEKLYNDILPFDDVEGSDSNTIGKLVHFMSLLFDFSKQLDKKHSFIDWQTLLMTALDDFLYTDANHENQLQQIRNVLQQLTEQAQYADFQKQVSYEVIFTYLNDNLASEPLPLHFLTGSVTFCSLLPMRSIPFKAICLLGMNDIAYPRSDNNLSFDLIAQYHQRGDRSVRYSDRYLFLEALLSARDYFYISYIGHSIHDNTSRQPSVLVNELLDYIKKGFLHPEHTILNYLTTSHPLQAFSHRYFIEEEAQLFSYSEEYCVVSEAALGERKPPKLFFTQALSMPKPEWKTVNIQQLIQFFSHPVEFLLKHRLGIQLNVSEGLLDDSEPFVVKGLEKYSLNQVLLEKGLNGHFLNDYYPIAKASGALPHGQVGDYVYGQLMAEITPFIEKVKQHVALAKLSNCAVNLDFANDMKIVGQIGHLWQDNLVYYRCAKVKAKDHIKVWLSHLILNCLSQPNLPKTSLLIGTDEIWQYTQVTESHAILQDLLNLYWQGLRQPLYFFPETSLTFSKAMQKDGEDAAFGKALRTWQGSEFNMGEGMSDYYQLCFGQLENVTPLETLDSPFKELAQQVFDPLLAHSEEIKD